MQLCDFLGIDQRMIYHTFLLYGNYDTFRGFLKQCWYAMYNPVTLELIEI